MVVSVQAGRSERVEETYTCKDVAYQSCKGLIGARRLLERVEGILDVLVYWLATVRVR